MEIREGFLEIIWKQNKEMLTRSVWGMAGIPGWEAVWVNLLNHDNFLIYALHTYLGFFTLLASGAVPEHLHLVRLACLLFGPGLSLCVCPHKHMHMYFFLQICIPSQLAYHRHLSWALAFPEHWRSQVKGTDPGPISVFSRTLSLRHVTL